jgi:hypothetical protein
MNHHSAASAWQVLAMEKYLLSLGYDAFQVVALAAPDKAMELGAIATVVPSLSVATALSWRTKRSQVR